MSVFHFDGWSWPDTNSESIANAAWKARYGTPDKKDLMLLATTVSALHYLMVECPTTEIAIKKVRMIRREARK